MGRSILYGYISMGPMYLWDYQCLCRCSEGQPRTPKAMGDGDGIGGALERETGCEERLIITKNRFQLQANILFSLFNSTSQTRYVMCSSS